MINVNVWHCRANLFDLCSAIMHVYICLIYIDRQQSLQAIPAVYPNIHYTGTLMVFNHTRDDVLIKEDRFH